MRANGGRYVNLVVHGAQATSDGVYDAICETVARLAPEPSYWCV